MKVKDLKKGDYFTKMKNLYPKSGRQVWIRGDYDRSQKAYECQNFDDANKYCYIRGDREVYTDLVF